MHQAAFKKGLRPTRRSWLCSKRCGHASGSTTMAPRANRRVLIKPLGRHWAMGVNNAFARLVEVLDGPRAQLVKAAAHFDPVVRVRVAPTLGCDQGAFFCRTALVSVWIVIRGLAQDETDLRREFPQQGGGDCGIGFMGGGEFSRDGNPPRGYRRDQGPLPSVAPTMPAGRGPMCCGIDGRVRDKALLPILRVPHPTGGPQRGTIAGRRSTPGGPGWKAGAQVTAPTTTRCWQGAGYGLQAPLPRPPRGIAAMLQQHGASGVQLRGGLVQPGQQRMPAMPMSDNHADQRVQAPAVRRELWPAPALLRWGRGHGKTVNQLDHGGKERVARDQSSDLRSEG